MKSSLLTKTELESEPRRLEDIQHTLDMIEQKIDSEIAAKQKSIELQEREIQKLHALAEEKNKMIIELNEKLTEGIQNLEGNRQLINKLLNDIDRLNHDIDWYKKTYETRSLLGTIKEKVLGRRK